VVAGKEFAFDALNALVAAIGTTGQRAGRPRAEARPEGDRAFLKFARSAAARANIKKGARDRWRTAIRERDETRTSPRPAARV
jgi:hypothetical protein